MPIALYAGVMPRVETAKPIAYMAPVSDYCVVPSYINCQDCGSSMHNYRYPVKYPPFWEQFLVCSNEECLLSYSWDWR